jgi:hypothetical protein
VVLPCRRERLKEMAAMKAARERQLEEEERYESSYLLKLKVESHKIVS